MLRLLVGLFLLSFSSFPVGAMDISGQLTSLAIQSTDSREQQGLTDFSRLRLKLEDQYGALSWQISYDNELLWGAGVRDPAFPLQAAQPEPTYMDASSTVRQSPSLYWRHTLYRGWLQYDAGAFKATLGRQRIAWGSGRIWNPTDRFNPVQPTALEPEQKLGVDALDVQWRYSGTGSFEGVAAPGRGASSTSKKSALRWQDTFGEFDVALMAARIGSERVAGLDITGNVGDASARLEWMQSNGGVSESGVQMGNYGQLAAGMDYTLHSSWFPEGLYLAAEYFYNGASSVVGTPSQDRLQSVSGQLIGLLSGYDLTPLWRVDLLSIVDLEQRGWFVAPSLTWSAMENLDIALIAQLPGGRPASEFGRFHHLYEARVDWYF